MFHLPVHCSYHQLRGSPHTRTHTALAESGEAVSCRHDGRKPAINPTRRLVRRIEPVRHALLSCSPLVTTVATVKWDQPVDPDLSAPLLALS